MNEPNGVAQGLESYVRHGLVMQRRPKIIILDTHNAKPRRELIQRYFNDGYLSDPVIINTDPAKEPFLEVSESQRPYGFQEWRKFGAPMGAPGQARHHPAVKEHELIGWMLAMHFLSALEVAAASIMHSKDMQVSDIQHDNTLPIPHHNVSKEMNNPTSLIFGVPKSPTTWKMNKIQCRTTFDPILTGAMQDILISGSSAEDIDVMLPKGPMLYNKNWVLDLGDTEKTAKRKIERYSGLGFLDIKKAYYGVFASGLLQLFLPTTIKTAHEMESAKDYFQSLVICEVNERKEHKECNLERDVTFMVGGVKAESVHAIEGKGVSYLGKKLCVNVGIPPSAKISSKKDITEDTEKIEKSEQVGIKLDIAISDPSIILRTGRCSISHIIWEEIVHSNV